MNHLDIQYYIELQKRLKEIFLFVSCNKENNDVYSIKIENLFVDSCAFFDSLSQTFIREKREMISEKTAKEIKKFNPKISGKEHFNMGDYRLILEELFQMSEKEIILNSYDEDFREFKKFRGLKEGEGYRIKPLAEWKEGKAPEWWNNFTSLKHDRLKNIKLANFESLIDSLGTVFVILAYRNEAAFKSGEIPDEVYDVFYPTFWTKKAMLLSGKPTWK